MQVKMRLNWYVLEAIKIIWLIAERGNAATNSRFLFDAMLLVELKRQDEFWELFIRHYLLFWVPAWVGYPFFLYLGEAVEWQARNMVACVYSEQFHDQTLYTSPVVYTYIVKKKHLKM